MSTTRPYPAMPGGCRCNHIRYKLETSPLYCYACHCTDCQKDTGSAFAIAANIEADQVTIVGDSRPEIVTEHRPGLWKSSAKCPKCHVVLWHTGSWSSGILNVQIGTLEHPNLMPPDIHMFIENKMEWLPLGEGLKTCKGKYDSEKEWPRSSHQRLEAFKKRFSAEMMEGKGYCDGDGVTEADKTPTAETPEERFEDEELDRRHDEIERALQERLEKLTLKLSEQEKGVA